MNNSDLTPMIEGVASEYGRKFGRWGVERADIAQELYLWLWKHPNKVAQWLSEDDGHKPLVTTLRHEASRVSQEWKAQYLGYSVNDLTFYAKGELRVLLDAMFDREAWTEPPVSEDGGRSHKAPAEGGNWVATLADVARGFEQLSEDDKQLLWAFHRDGMTNLLLAEMYGISPQAMSKKHDKAVSRLHRLLGGERPRDTHDNGTDGCECEYVGTRKAMSNAAARAAVENNYQEDQ